MSYATWQLDVVSGDGCLIDDDGKEVGSVKPHGGSWLCVYNSETIAVRPDKESAMRCVSKVHNLKELSA